MRTFIKKKIEEKYRFVEKDGKWKNQKLCIFLV